jgi:hypothetical protein
MASRISGFGDIHQGIADGNVRFIAHQAILLYIQWLIPAISVESAAPGRAFPYPYIGPESANSKGLTHRPLPFHPRPRAVASDKTM